MKLFCIKALLGATTLFLDITHSEIQKAKKIESIISYSTIKNGL